MCKNNYSKKCLFGRNNPPSSLKYILLILVILIFIIPSVDAGFWNASHHNRKEINVTAGESEPIYLPVFNDSDVNSSTGYPDAMRIIQNISGVQTEIASSLFNTSKGLHIQWIANVSQGTQFYIYYNSSAGSPSYPEYHLNNKIFSVMELFSEPDKEVVGSSELGDGNWSVVTEPNGSFIKDNELYINCTGANVDIRMDFTDTNKSYNEIYFGFRIISNADALGNNDLIQTEGVDEAGTLSKTKGDGLNNYEAQTTPPGLPKDWRDVITPYNYSGGTSYNGITMLFNFSDVMDNSTFWLDGIRQGMEWWKNNNVDEEALYAFLIAGSDDTYWTRWDDFYIGKNEFYTYSDKFSLSIGGEETFQEEEPVNHTPEIWEQAPANDSTWGAGNTSMLLHVQINDSDSMQVVFYNASSGIYIPTCDNTTPAGFYNQYCNWTVSIGEHCWYANVTDGNTVNTTGVLCFEILAADNDTEMIWNGTPANGTTYDINTTWVELGVTVNSTDQFNLYFFNETGGTICSFLRQPPMGVLHYTCNYSGITNDTFYWEGNITDGITWNSTGMLHFIINDTFPSVELHTPDDDTNASNPVWFTFEVNCENATKIELYISELITGGLNLSGYKSVEIDNTTSHDGSWMGNVSGDGKEDVVSGNAAKWYEQGDDQFNWTKHSFSRMACGVNCEETEGYDFDDNGHTEILVGEHAGGRVGITCLEDNTTAVIADAGGGTVQSIKVVDLDNDSDMDIMFSHNSDGFYILLYSGGDPCNTNNWNNLTRIFDDDGAYGISKDYVDFNDDGIEDVAIQSDNRGVRYLLSPAYENITDTWDDTIVNRTKGGRHIAVGNLTGQNKDIISSGKPDGLANGTMENNKLSLFIHPDWNETYFTARKPAVEGENLDLKNYSEVIATREGQVGIDNHSFVMILKRNSTSGIYYKYWEENYSNDYGISCKLPDPILTDDVNNDGYKDFVIDAQNSENLKLFYSSVLGAGGYSEWKAYKEKSPVTCGANNTIQFNFSQNFTLDTQVVWNIKVTELGGKTAFAPFNFTLEVYALGGGGNSAPNTPVINSPPDNEDYINGTTTIQVNATYSDPDGDIGNLSLVNNATDTTVDINDSLFNDTWGILTWAGLSNGTWCYYITATDNNSQSTNSAVQCFTINGSGGAPPGGGAGNWTVQLISPLNDSSHADTNWVELVANASNLGSQVPEAIFYNDTGGIICNATDQRVAGSGISYTMINVSTNMTYGFELNNSIDNNISTYIRFVNPQTGNITFNFSENTLHSFNIFSAFLQNCSEFGCVYQIDVFNGSWVTDNTSNILFNHSEWDIYTFSPSYENARALRLFINASGAKPRIWEINYSTSLADDTHQYTCNYTGLDASTYLWTFNISNSTFTVTNETWQFTINNSAPTITLNYPDNNSIFFSDVENITVNITYTDRNGDSGNITIYNDTGGVICSTTGLGSGSDYTCDVINLTTGDHNITINATDDSGLTTSIILIFEVSDAFSIELHNPLNGAINLLSDVKFNITIFTNGSNVNISIYDNSDTLLYNISGVSNDTDINFTWYNLSLATTFYWYVNMTTEIDILTSVTYHFTTTSGDIDNCSVFNNSVLTFFFFDEKAPTTSVNSDIDIVLRSAALNYTFNGRNKTNYTICLSGSSLLLTSGWIEYRSEDYEAVNYTQRDYYILDTVLNASSPTDINLYLLDDASSTAVLFHTTDAAGADYPDVYGYIQKYYVGEDTYRSIAMIHTDDQADAITYIEQLDVWYRFVLFQEDTILISTDPTQIKTDEYYLKISSEIGNYNDYIDIKNFRYNHSFDRTTNITRYDIVSTDGLTSYACLDIVLNKLSGKTTVYSHCETTSSASMFYDMENDSEKGTYLSYASVIEPDGTTHVLDVIEIGRVTSTNVFGLEGVLLTAIGGGTAAFSGLANPIAPIVLGIITLGALIAFGFYQVELLAFTSIAMVGGILIYLLRR